LRIAIATEGDSVSQHFGRCSSYTIVDIEGNKVVSRKVIYNPGHQPGFLPKFLKEHGAECIIAGGMGARAQSLFAEAGIKTVLGITGRIDDVIKQLLDGTLKGGESLCEHEEARNVNIQKETLIINRLRRGRKVKRGLFPVERSV
jgi:predicted Fe-Mo cluster-binding NifX family protein